MFKANTNTSVNIEHISHFFPVFLLLTWSMCLFAGIAVVSVLLTLKMILSADQVYEDILQPAITCSKFTIETLEQGVKYVQS